MPSKYFTDVVTDRAMQACERVGLEFWAAGPQLNTAWATDGHDYWGVTYRTHKGETVVKAFAAAQIIGGYRPWQHHAEREAIIEGALAARRTVEDVLPLYVIEIELDEEIAA